MTTAPNLDQIKQSILSADAEVRGRAMQALLDLARKDPDVHQEAISIFVGALMNEPSPWAAMNAARGIALIAGPQEGRRAWRTLLDHPREAIAGAVASVVDSSMAGVLLEVLDRRAESGVQIPAMRSLGRMKYAPAYDALVRRLGEAALRPHAIEALGDLGDARAVEPLQKYLNDKTEAWREDNNGPMLRIRDLAKIAIVRISPAPPTPPAHLAKAAAAAQPAGPQKLAPQAQPANVWSYVPIVAALIELPWLGLVLFAALFTMGTLKTTDWGTQVLDLISMVPAALGLLGGVVALLRGGPRSGWEGVCLGVGFILCGLFTFSFGWEFFHPHVEQQTTIPVLRR